MSKAFPEDHIYAAYVVFWASPDHWRTGASFHVSLAEAASFVKAIADNKKRGNALDDDSPVSNKPVLVRVNKSFYENLYTLKSIRVKQDDMKGIIIKE